MKRNNIPDVDWRELVDTAAEAWPTPGVYTGILVELDLTTPAGRWELLVLAMFSAARVREEVAEETLAALQTVGCLLPEILAAQAEARQEVWSIVNDVYRAPVDKTKKVDALFENAALLLADYDGDLHNSYRRRNFSEKHVARSSAALLADLRSFKQIDTRGKWYCRCMCAAGIWPHVSLEAQFYIDIHVRRALQRLGLVPTYGSWPELQNEMAAVVANVFAGETTNLYKLGRFGCLGSDAASCRELCILHPYCRHRRVMPGS